MPRHSLRSLTRLDLEDIRRVVRDEIAAAIGANARGPDLDTAELETEAMNEDIRELLVRMDREAKERAARPIPDTRFVDRYDAARLLGVAMETITSYTKRGWLTRRMVKGRIEVSRAEIDALLADATRRRRCRRS